MDLAPLQPAHQGNGGMAIPETDMDSLGLVTLSYGNQGLNPDLVVESGCLSSNGTVDCTGETVLVGNRVPRYDNVQTVVTLALCDQTILGSSRSTERRF